MEQTEVPKGLRSRKSLERLELFFEIMFYICLAGALAHALYVIITTSPLLDGETYLIVMFSWLGAAIAVAALGSFPERALRKNYLTVTNGVVTSYGVSKKGHPYLIVKGLNGVNQETEQRKYPSIMAWRTYDIGDVYPKPQQ